jgi:phosphoribosylformylglycinamidine cyclo-ligase
MMRGLADAARACGVAVTGGEIACLGSRVGGYGPGAHVNWCATALGVIPDGRDPISGRAIEAGDAVVALRNVGLRSNGLTLARSILDRAFGPLWHVERAAEGLWGDLLLSPSIVYAPGVVAVLRSGADVHGIAHITGGGIPSNLGRIVAGHGLGATLDALYAPDPWLIELARVGDVRPVEAYGQWNMGNGMLLVVPKSQAQRVVGTLAERRLEARVAGTIVRGGTISVDARAWGFSVHEFPAE